MKIFIASDHRGINLCTSIMDYLKEEKLEIIKSSLPNDEMDDYPDFAFDVSHQVLKNEDSIGILICGNGIGISIAANKVKGIRCARVLNRDDAFAAKNHNGANIIAFGGIEFEKAKEIVDMFIATKAISDERHLRRVNKIMNYENGTYNEL